MDPVDLERLIDRELRSLPAPRAPRTLLPRVMAAANEAANRPWYSRTWLQWPVGWQLASALVLFHFEDASYEEIARTLRVSLAKVKTDIHRGREALRKQLETESPAKAGLYRDRDGSR